MEQALSSGIGRPLAGLILTALVVMGSPGPSTMSVTAVGAAFGLRRSLAYLSGLVLGTVAVLLAVAAGIVSMLLSVPRLAPVLLAVSAAYILYLACKIATAPPLRQQDEAASAPSFAGGLLLAVANPKAYAAITAVFASAPLALDSHLIEAMLKISVLTMMIVAIHSVWLLAGASLSRILRHPIGARLINLLLAAVLIVTTVMALMHA